MSSIESPDFLVTLKNEAKLSQPGILPKNTKFESYIGVKCSFTKKSFRTLDLPKHITCELSNIIYLITCTKCHKHYVGETSRAFRKRMYEHKASVLKDGLITPVSRHFKNDGHSHKHMQFSVLQWCTPKFDIDSTSKRRRIELCWIFKLHSLAPIGFKICMNIYSYHLDCNALSSLPSFFFCHQHIDGG